MNIFFKKDEKILKLEREKRIEYAENLKLIDTNINICTENQKSFVNPTLKCGLTCIVGDKIDDRIRVQLSNIIETLQAMRNVISAMDERLRKIEN